MLKRGHKFRFALATVSKSDLTLPKKKHFSATCYLASLACRTYATSMTSVRPSVTMVDCDHTVQQEVCNSANGRIGRRLACRSQPGSQYPVITNSMEEEQWVWKNVEFCTLPASNGSHVALSQHVLKRLNRSISRLAYLWLTLCWKVIRLLKDRNVLCLQTLDRMMSVVAVCQLVGQRATVAGLSHSASIFVYNMMGLTQSVARVCLL